ncbi:MAG: hypothetical protein GY899_04700, partial [Verrucomicrobiaceae bacterium]|nr:hypothetical protein [Verrucomicrobiaceae bacterium]
EKPVTPPAPEPAAEEKPVTPPAPEPAAEEKPVTPPAPEPAAEPQPDGCQGEEEKTAAEPAPEEKPITPPVAEPAPEEKPVTPPVAEPAPEEKPVTPPVAEPAPGEKPATKPATPLPPVTPVLTAEEKAELNEEYFEFITGFLEKARKTAPYETAQQAITDQNERILAFLQDEHPRALENIKKADDNPDEEEKKRILANSNRALKRLEEMRERLAKLKEKVTEKPEAPDFATLAKEYSEQSKDSKMQVTYRKLEAFSELEAPEELKDKAQVISRVFADLSESNPIITPNDATGHWIIRLVKIEEPKTLSLEEAREQIKETLTAILALDAIDEKLNAAREKLVKSTKDGPSFKTAAESLGLTVERIAYDRSPPSNPKINTNKLRDTVNETAAGQISLPQHDSEKGGLLVYVAEKSLNDEETAAQRKKDSIARSLKSGGLFSPSYKLWLFRSWLKQARKEAKPEPMNLESILNS